MKTVYFALLAAALTASGLGQDALTVVANGEPRAVIVLEHDASEPLTNAVAAMRALIEQASGASLQLADAPPVGMAAIHVGRSRAAEGIDFSELDGDGFVIAVTDARTCIIAGPTDWGTEFGVYEFLERFVGVRWLMPGPDGTDVPSQPTITVPLGEVRDEPVYFSRLMSGLRGEPQLRWARLNRMHGRVKFHHNLLRLFPPEVYVKTHPHFFPMTDGQTRFLPPEGSHSWQPCLTAPGIVEEAVRTIVRYFDEHPEETSYSLGMNDSTAFCRCPDCMARVPAERNFLGSVDYSDLYYDWCNRIIEGVLDKHPDKWFGCLAYHNVGAPPRNTPVHPRLIPYMTYDRMKWVDPEIEAAGHTVTEAWETTSPAVGWYDYIYGSPYCVPRVYFHHCQTYLQYGRQHHVKALYAELYPNWGEGPKPYIFLKLWWNPDRNVDQLLSEWYERCAGPEGARPLAQYYAIWERFWTQDILQSKWFSKGGQWLGFTSPRYLADVDRADITQSRRLLESARDACRTDSQRARVTLLLQAFEYYEASALTYLAGEDVRAQRPATSAAAIANIEKSLEILEMAQKRRHLALNVFPSHPVLLHPLRIDRYAPLGGTDWGGKGMWPVMDWIIRGDEAVIEKLRGLASRHASPAVRDQVALVLAVAEGRLRPASRNSSFEEGDGLVSEGWWYWRKPEHAPVGRMLRTQEKARTGTASLLCDGIERGGPVQDTDFAGPHERCCGMAWAYVPAGQTANGTVELLIRAKDDAGKTLSSFSTKLAPEPGQWSVLLLEVNLSRGPLRKTAKLQIIPVVDGFQDGKVYLDDVGLFHLKP